MQIKQHKSQWHNSRQVKNTPVDEFVQTQYTQSIKSSETKPDQEISVSQSRFQTQYYFKARPQFLHPVRAPPDVCPFRIVAPFRIFFPASNPSNYIPDDHTRSAAHHYHKNTRSSQKLPRQIAFHPAAPHNLHITGHEHTCDVPGQPPYPANYPSRTRLSVPTRYSNMIHHPTSGPK